MHACVSILVSTSVCQNIGGNNQKLPMAPGFVKVSTISQPTATCCRILLSAQYPLLSAARLAENNALRESKWGKDALVSKVSEVRGKIGRLLCAACVAAIMIGATSAFSGGFYLTEFGSPNSLGTASSGNVTNFDVPDAAWTNPAGMTSIYGPSLRTCQGWPQVSGHLQYLGGPRPQSGHRQLAGRQNRNLKRLFTGGIEFA